MKRSPNNLKLYQGTVQKVMERASNRCEVLVDKHGMACVSGDKKRCLKFIAEDSATYTNFLHTETRNGKPDEWVLNPENIIFGCVSHHHEEERTGIRVERCSYEEIYYLPEEN